jgi:FG-GAP-like repeat
MTLDRISLAKIAGVVFFLSLVLMGSAQNLPQATSSFQPVAGGTGRVIAGRSEVNGPGVSPTDSGNPLFLSAVAYDSGGLPTNSLAVADVNGDGKPDIVVTNFFDTFYNSTSGLVGVLLGNGDGTFQKVVTYPSGEIGASRVVLADVNGDHKLDLLVSNSACPNTNDAQCAGVLLGNGDGTFQPVSTYKTGGGEVTSIAVADVNGDGKPDLLVTNWCVFCANTVGVLLGNGDGTFQAPVTYGSGGYGASSAEAADINGDGKPDLLVANNCHTKQTFCSNSRGSVGGGVPFWRGICRLFGGCGCKR